MPNTSSAKKSMRQNAERRLRNRSQRSALRSLLKKCRSAAQSGDRDATDVAFRMAVKRIDQSVAKKLIHKNAAARTKSRLARFIQRSFAPSGD